MPLKRRKPKDEMPEWLRSTHQALTNSMSAGGKTTATSKDLKEGLIRLEVTPEDLDNCPKIEHLFKGIGGRQQVFEYLSGSEEPDARKILDLRKRLSGKQIAAVPFEAYCLAAGISPKKMFGIVAAEVLDQEAKAKQIMVAAKHTQVVEATIESALDPEFGSADRRMMHQATGFVPVPKNSITHIHGNQTIDQRSQATMIAVLPPVEDTVRRLADRFNDRVLDIKALPAPAPIEEEDEEDDS